MSFALLAQILTKVGDVATSVATAITNISTVQTTANTIRTDITAARDNVNTAANSGFYNTNNVVNAARDNVNANTYAARDSVLTHVSNVVVANKSAVKSVQRGTTSVPSGGSVNVTIGWVNTAKALLVCSPNNAGCAAVLVNNTTLTVYGATSGGSTMYWQVIEHE